MFRTVLLPRELDQRLSIMAKIPQEVDGILLYRRQGDSCPVEAMFMTGIGDAGHVKPRPERIRVLNGFFQRQPQYSYVLFHTHTKETLARYGAEFGRKFSQGDFAEFREIETDYADFMGLLATPETKLLYGRDSPQLLVVETIPDFAKRNYAINGIIERIAEEQGCDLGAFTATAK